MDKQHIKKTAEYIFYFLIFSLLYFPYCLHIFFNENLRILHASVFSFIFFITIISPKIGLIVTIASLSWFEHPTLIYQFPNHFLSDTSILAIILGIFLRTKRKFLKDSFNINQPFVLTFLALAIITFFQFIGMIVRWDAVSPNGIDFIKIFGLIGRNIQTWNIQANPIHNLSVAYSYLIQLFLIWTVIKNHKYLLISSNEIRQSLILGSIPTFVYGIVQVKFPHIITHRYTINIGATFQNGNHLTYYSGIIIMLIVWSLYSRSSKMRAINLMILPVAIWSMFVGHGRSAFIAFISAILASQILGLLVHRVLKKDKISENRILVSMPFILCILMAFGVWSYWETINFSGLNELKSIFSRGTYSDLIFAGGRKVQYKQAWLAFKENWLFGVGDGAFFNLSGLNYEIHNIFLKIAVGNGFFPAIILVASFTIYFMALFSSKKPSFLNTDRIWSFSLGLYIFSCMMPDSYVFFRSLLSITNLVICSSLLLAGSSYPFKILVPKISVAVVSLLFAVIGSYSIVSPPLYKPKNQAYADSNYDKSIAAQYKWYHRDLYIALPKNKCLSAKVFPFPPAHIPLPFNYGLVDKNSLPSKYLNKLQYQSFVASELTQSISLQSRQWQDICFCNGKSDNQYLYFSSKYSEFLSLSKNNFGQDDRQISFGLAKMSINSETSKTQTNCGYL